MPTTQITVCAECDSTEPIGKTRGGLDPLDVCPDCRTVEGATRTLTLNGDES